MFCRVGAPYVFEKKGENGANSTIEGFAYDLIEEIAKAMNFTFKFEIHDQYGKYDPATKSWNGLIKELLDRVSLTFLYPNSAPKKIDFSLQRAHLAICDLTITEARRSVVDFTLPFMNLGIVRRLCATSK